MFIATKQTTNSIHRRRPINHSHIRQHVYTVHYTHDTHTGVYHYRVKLDPADRAGCCIKTSKPSQVVGLRFNPSYVAILQ